MRDPRGFYGQYPAVWPRRSRPLQKGTRVLLRVGIRTKTIRTYRATSMDVCGRQRLVLQAEPLILTRR
jgi:hypothetical protein